MKTYIPDPDGDIMVFRALWRKHIRWMTPSNDQLRRLMYQWCPRYDRQFQKALRIVAESFNHSGTFDDTVRRATAVMHTLWQNDKEAYEEQRKEQRIAEKAQRAALKAAQAKQAAKIAREIARQEEQERRKLAATKPVIKPARKFKDEPTDPQAEEDFINFYVNSQADELGELMNEDGEVIV